MSAFKTLFTDTFVRANENPLSDGGKWAAFSGYPNKLQVLNNQCVSVAAIANTAEYCTVGLPNDQFYQVTVPTWSSANGGNQVLLWARASASSQNSGYIFNANSGSSGNWFLFSNGISNVLASGNATFAAGDTLLLAAVGIFIYVYHNGSLLVLAFDSTISSGNVALGTQLNSLAAITDVAFTNFQAGSEPPATSGAVYGQYNGSGGGGISSFLSTTFGNTSQQDLLQIVDPFGKVVFNIDYQGNANDNPANPTPAAVIGQFQAHSGSTRAQYIASAFDNPTNLDIIQVVGEGGGVIYWVDFLGNPRDILLT